MNVFIGWSGERSRAVALALREWIPNVIQAANPWMSEEDISKGSTWTSELVVQLGQACFRIICVTPENREALWLAFEAGALRVLDKGVCPFLLGLEPTDLKGPLGLLQWAKAEREDRLRMAMPLSEGKWRAEVAEPEGEDRLMDCFFDCDTKQIAENTADSLVQEGYPHSCGKEACGTWGAVLVRTRQKQGG